MGNQFKCPHRGGEHLPGNSVLKKVKDSGYHSLHPGAGMGLAL